MNRIKEVYGLQVSVRLLWFQLLVIGMLFGCTGNYHKTYSGLEYKIYTSNHGPKAKVGDFLSMYLIYKAPNDSVLFDSHRDGAPWHFQLMTPPFHGAYEEGLTLLAAGDSAEFLVSADSMFSIVFKKPMPAGFKPDSKLKFDVKLEKIETPEEAELVNRKMIEERNKIEQREIDEYLKAHHLDITPTPDGLYFLKELKSNGASPDRGDVCLIEYTGRFLNGEAFESSDMDHHAKQVTLGENAIIKGWEEALLMMRTGEKAMIIVPSRLAYGDEGRRNKANGQYDIYPYTPLIYELQLRAVKGGGRLEGGGYMK